jgi:hypothetical protein
MAEHGVSQGQHIPFKPPVGQTGMPLEERNVIAANLMNGIASNRVHYRGINGGFSVCAMGQQAPCN